MGLLGVIWWGVTLGMVSWQQGVRYQIQVRLNVDSTLIEATETLVYTNHSPDTLPFVWFHLYPNAYQKTSIYAREAAQEGNFRLLRAREQDLGWIEVTQLTQDGVPCSTKVVDTEMKVYLPQPLLPGSTTTFTMHFTVKLSKIFSRMGHDRGQFVVTQWYPKVAVYDSHRPVAPPLGLPESEYRGRSGWWHPDGYHATGEFYGEYGTYDVWITVPEPFQVGATGQQVGEDHVGRWKTLYFHAEQVHDFAWIADSTFVVRDTVFQNTSIQFFIRRDVAHVPLWDSLRHEVPRILQKFSEWFFPYPYSTLKIVNGTVGISSGMEYPTLVLISLDPKIAGLASKVPSFYEAVVVHEIAHQWFYGILGNNEMDEAWLDEGFATFAEQRYMHWRQQQKTWFSDPITEFFQGNPVEAIEEIGLYWQLNSSWDEPILGRKAYEATSYWTNIYTKGAKVLWMLWEILGPEPFDSLMRGYFETYAFHHVTTEDFLRWVEAHVDFPARQILSPWLYETPKPDLRVAKVEKALQDGQEMATLAVQTGVSFPLPVSLNLQGGRGETLDTVVLMDPSANRITVPFTPTHIELDPHNVVPETDEWNNALPRKILWSSAFHLKPFQVDAFWLFWTPWVTWDSPTGWVPGVALFGTQALLRHTLLLSLGYSLKTHRPMVSFSLQEPMFQTLARWGVEINLLPGGSEARVHFQRNFLSRMLTPSRQSLSVEWFHEAIQDLRFYNTEIFERGIHQRLSFLYRWSKSQPFWTLHLRGKGSMGFGRWRYRKVTGFIKGSVGFPWSVSAWIFGGAIFGEAPKQEQFLLQGATREPPLYGLLIPSTGSFSPSGTHLSIGPGLWGSAGELQRGSAKFVAGIALRIRWVEVYGQIGNVWTILPKSPWNQLRSEAGITLGGSWGKVVFPLWTTEKQWRFQFVFWVPKNLL